MRRLWAKVAAPGIEILGPGVETAASFSPEICLSPSSKLFPFRLVYLLSLLSPPCFSLFFPLFSCSLCSLPSPSISAFSAVFFPPLNEKKSLDVTDLGFLQTADCLDDEQESGWHGLEQVPAIIWRIYCLESAVDCCGEE